MKSLKPDNQIQKTTLFLIPLALGAFALSPLARAVSPPPDGAYPNLNTAEGFNALGSTNGCCNAAIGFGALGSNNGGYDNVASGAFALQQNITGWGNTATGTSALVSNTNGAENTAMGVFALKSNNGNGNTADGSTALENNTTGLQNTAVGFAALLSNITGSYNTATGADALFSNRASNNTATGFKALFNNTTGGHNTATGYAALQNNSSAADNTGIGYQALFNNDAIGNTALGSQALLRNITGIYNTAIGPSALLNNTAGSWNTATGTAALAFNQSTGSQNTADGAAALLLNTTGSNNIAVGADAGFNLTTGDNNIDIGNEGVATENNTIRIGTEVAAGTPAATYIAHIVGETTDPADTVPVLIDANGKLGTKPSSRRFKRGIKPMDKASEVILSLKPVTFYYKNAKLDTPQFGLIAEDVAKVDPDLVTRDKNGEIYTVRYDQINAMLLNEFLKERHRVEELNSTFAKQEAAITEQGKDFHDITSRQQKEIADLATTVKEQALQIQKVTARLELSKSSPRTVLNDQ